MMAVAAVAAAAMVADWLRPFWGLLSFTRAVTPHRYGGMQSTVSQAPDGPCAAMFDDLGLSMPGYHALTSTRYRNGKDVGRCSDPNAGARVGVNSVYAYLCGPFWNQPQINRTQAAIILIHEALHTAGLNELLPGDDDPAHADWMTPQLITAMVDANCDP